MFKIFSLTALLLLSISLSAQDSNAPAENPTPAPEQPAVDDAPKPQASTTPKPAPIEVKRLPRLTVNVTGLTPGVGTVEVSLFNSADTFMKEPFFQEAGTPDADGNLQVRFLNVFEGTYGLVVVHDENGNSVYDAGFLGFGAEPVGYSNNARPWLGRPSFEATSFEVQEDLEVTLDMD